MIRHFYLQNESGEIFELTNRTDLFIINPRFLGLGASNYYVANNNNFVPITTNINQQTIEFTVIVNGGFIDASYTAYNALANFLMTKGLRLYYSTALGTFYKYVNFRLLSKSEVSEFNVFRETLELESKSSWRSDVVTTIIGSGTSSTGNTLGVSYSQQGTNRVYHQWNYDGSAQSTWDMDLFGQQQNGAEVALTTFQVTNTSITLNQHNTPMILKITGNSNSQLTSGYISYTLTDSNGNVQSDSFAYANGFDNTGAVSLVVSSDPFDFYANWVDSNDNVIASAISNQDITKTNFITSPVGTATFVFNDFYTVEVTTVLERDII